MIIEESIYNKMPSHIKAYFDKLPNPARDEVLAVFPQTKSGGNRVQRKSKNEGGNNSMNTMMRPAGYTTAGHNDSGSAARFFYCAKASKSERNAGLEGMEKKQKYAKNGQGGSHEIFTSESANDSEWAKKNPNLPVQNHHPTVKPIALMRYLCKLSRTPSGGVVLDPFAGSGSTGVAAILEGRDFIGIDMEADYIEIERARIEDAQNRIKSAQPALAGL